MADPTLEAKVDRLLHDAEHALGGANVAAMMGDHVSQKKLRAKHARLVAEANVLDPDKTCEAWRLADV